MGRVVTESRRRASARRRKWLGRNGARLAAVGAGTIVVLVVFTIWVLWLDLDDAMTYYLLGAVHAGAVAVLIGGIHTVYLLHDGEGAHQLRGAWGEENTRDELRKARRRGHIWDAAHDVRLEVGDLDHVVATRRGGIVVLDSKWRSIVSDGAAVELAERARRVRTRAEALVDTHLPRQRGRRMAQRAKVRPAVVVWGAMASHLPPDFSHDGVDVIPGNQLCDWLAGLDGTPVERDVAEEFLAEVRRFSAEVAARAAASSSTTPAGRR